LTENAGQENDGPSKLQDMKLDIFIHHRGGRNKQKKNSDNNNNNMEERRNLTNLTNFQ